MAWAKKAALPLPDEILEDLKAGAAFFGKANIRPELPEWGSGM
jgi:hypothetical protein